MLMTETAECAEGVAVRFLRDGQVMTWADVAAALGESEFLAEWCRAWATDFSYMWKPLPLESRHRGHPFFVVLARSRFAAANRSAFQDKLSSVGLAASFPNLSGRSQLVIPTQRGDYGHLQSFSLHAPQSEQSAFWWAVGDRVNSALRSHRPVWCNTHGHGVPWLHMRFDPNHKYAAFSPRGAIDDAAMELWRRIYERAFEK